VLARTSNNLLDWTVIRDGKALNIIDLRRIWGSYSRDI
jgi:hypothetical protein